MTLKLDMQGYFDADGLVAYQPVPPGTRNASGNGVMLTSLYYMQLQARGELVDSDILDFCATISGCAQFAGLYNRGPVQPDQQAQDDLVMLALASKKIGLLYSTSMLEYGRSTFPRYLYNNVNPGSMKFKDGRWNWNAWLGRMPQFVAHLQYCAGETPGFIKRLIWREVIDHSGKPGDQDSWLLSWALCEAARGQTGLVANTILDWEMRMHGSFPGGMKEVIAKCLNPEHPIAVYWKDG